MTIPTHEQERQAILKEYPLTYFIAAAALFIVFGILIGALLFGQNSPLADADNNYFSNVYLTIISTAFTVIVIEGFNRRREERQLKEQLLRDVRSNLPDVVNRALHEIREREWFSGANSVLKDANLFDANIRNAYLYGANLSGTDLQRANLSSTDLRLANLSGASLIAADLSSSNLQYANLSVTNAHSVNMKNTDLTGVYLHNASLLAANLEGAEIVSANLSGIDLRAANLSLANLRSSNLNGADLSAACLNGADLSAANLNDAKLIGADLRGAKLEAANLSRVAFNSTDLKDTDRDKTVIELFYLLGQSVMSKTSEYKELRLNHGNLRQAKFDQISTLPDGTNWTPDTDLTRFTDPNHPNFWRSDDDWSPAYRGADDAPTATPPPKP